MQFTKNIVRLIAVFGMALGSLASTTKSTTA